MFDPLSILLGIAGGGLGGYLLKRQEAATPPPASSSSQPDLARRAIGVVSGAAAKRKCELCRQMTHKYVEFSDGTVECARHH